MAIFLDNKILLYNRTYNTILDILGNIGGLFDLLLFVGMVIVGPISKISLDLNLVNEVFSFEESKQIRKPMANRNNS